MVSFLQQLTYSVVLLAQEVCRDNREESWEKSQEYMYCESEVRAECTVVGLSTSQNAKHFLQSEV
jgi:hypothetical protein